MKPAAIGTICRIIEASTFAMSVYNKYRNKGLKLLCPCKIPRTARLVVVDRLNQTLALLSPYENRKQLTVVPWSDLEKF